jgi:hypothetical protein
MRNCFIFIFLCANLQAANFFVRPNGGTYGAENGTDWSNAYDGFSDITWASVAAGDTVWIAGGTYTQNLTPTSGKKGTSGNEINIRRARADSSVCTSATGWSSGFDATVTMSNVGIELSDNDFMVISGATTASGGAIGWILNCPSFTGEDYASTYNNTSNSRLEWIKFTGPGHVNYTGDSRAISLSAAGTASDLTFSHIWIDKFTSAIFINGPDNITFDYLEMTDCSALNSASWHPNGIWSSGCSGLTVSHSYFHTGSEGFGCGEGIFAEQSGGNANWTIHNTVFAHLNSTGLKPIQITSALSGLKVYNCTGYDLLTDLVYINGGSLSSSEVKNCLVPNGSIGGSGATAANNITANVSCFTDAANNDFTIISSTGGNFPRNAGTALASTYEIDRAGNTHGADGTWDVGAYEYTSGGGGTTGGGGSGSSLTIGGSITIGGKH